MFKSMLMNFYIKVLPIDHNQNHLMKLGNINYVMRLSGAAGTMRMGGRGICDDGAGLRYLLASWPIMKRNVKAALTAQCRGMPGFCDNLRVVFFNSC